MNRTAKACATAAGYLRLADSSGHCASGYRSLALPDAHLGQTNQLQTNYFEAPSPPVTRLTLPAGSYEITWEEQSWAYAYLPGASSNADMSALCTLTQTGGSPEYDSLAFDTLLSHSNATTVSGYDYRSSTVAVTFGTTISLTVGCTAEIFDESHHLVANSSYQLRNTAINAVRTGTLHSIRSGFPDTTQHRYTRRPR